MSKFFGSNLKKVMKEKRMTQKMLASFVNVSRSTISKYVTGKSEPSIDVLRDISEQLHVSCDYLIKGEEKPQKRIGEKMSELTPTQILQIQQSLNLLVDSFK